MKRLNNLVATLLISAMLASMTGCGAMIVGGVAAAGTFAYVNGDAKGTYFTSLPNAIDASLATCKELGIPVTKQTTDASSSEILGKLYGDMVTITLDLVGEDLTEITVRVGLWGNESASRRIHHAISQKL
ncbi:MAG: DUF3568 domain-containing protein [Pseudodesulfovibrio sp.]